MMDEWVWSIGCMINDGRNLKYWLVAIVSTINPIWNALGSKPGLHSEQPVNV
jgi:hypothetical protein